MRQYASQKQSGTMMNSQRGKEPLDNVIDRVMAIAQRVVGAENVIKNHVSEIAALKDQVKTLSAETERLTTKIENIALKASGKEFKKPTARKPQPKPQKPLKPLNPDGSFL